MSQLLDKNKLQSAMFAAAGLGILLVLAKRQQLISIIQKWKNPLAGKQIEIIQTADECRKVVNLLKRHCVDYNVLGFDCEWVTVNGHRRPIALLQLSSEKGFCALFRLCSLQQIPKSLRQLLEDINVIKVGVDPIGDAKKLSHDYGVKVTSTFDLRFLAITTNRIPQGLAAMSLNILHVKLDKNWRLACSDWEAKVLNNEQLNYAANDAMVAIEIFKKLTKELKPGLNFNLKRNNLKEVFNKLQPFLDRKYRQNITNNIMVSEALDDQKIKKSTSLKNKIMHVRGMATRSEPLYDNYYLEAPDGELLSTINKNKAQWYLEKNLASQVDVEPFTIRLNFEPANRAVGDAGSYYKMPKENQCVVCGCRDALVRKNIVPREYRKHFPDVMKSHSSHDILLLCLSCHQTSNIADLKVREILSKMCNAPISTDNGNAKYLQKPDLKRVKSAARALFINGERIPFQRREQLKLIVLNHYNETKLTDELLIDAAYLDIRQCNDLYVEHGAKVVADFQNCYGGLTLLEKIWRSHFLKVMKPEYLPSLWDVNYNSQKLETHSAEKRKN